jgi:hypothetical protein
VHVTGTVTSLPVTGRSAVFWGRATVTGLGAGHDRPFTVTVTAGGPGGGGRADRLRAHVPRDPHRRPSRRQLRPDVTSGRPGRSTEQGPGSGACCADLPGAGADPPAERKEASIPGLRRRACAGGFSLSPGGASLCAAPRPARRRRRKAVTEKSRQ